METAPAGAWALQIRLPAWVRAGTATVAGESVPLDPASGSLSLERAWSAGDRVQLDLEMPAGSVQPHPAVDAVCGCVAVERGPLVYCVDQADVPGGPLLDDVGVDVSNLPVLGAAVGLPETIRALELQG